MSMSTHLIGFLKTGEKFRQMKRVFDTCKEAGVSLPHEVQTYFHDVSLEDGEQIDLEIVEGVKKHTADMEDGFEIDLGELLRVHPRLEVIRFYNSY